MWICQNCGADVEENRITCGNCSWLRGGPLPRQRSNAGAVAPRSLGCLRCQTQLKFLGAKHFREGSGAPGFWLGDLGELLIQTEQFDLYACPRCGHVEFFLHGFKEVKEAQE